MMGYQDCEDKRDMIVVSVSAWVYKGKNKIQGNMNHSNQRFFIEHTNSHDKRSTNANLPGGAPG